LLNRKWLIAVITLLLIPLTSLHLEAQQAQVTYTVQPGDNLFRIALRYGTTVEALAAANQIADVTHVYVGQVLVIPGAAAAPTQSQPQPAPTNAPTNPPPPPQPTAVQANAAPVYYTVQVGDTLNIISRKFGVTVADMIRVNQIGDANHIEPGQQVVIPGASSPAGSATVPTVSDAQAAPPPTAIPTNVPPTNVPPTAIPPTPLPTTAPVQPPPAQPTTEQTHVVQPGEGLAAIGRKYNVDWGLIAGANNITDPNTIYAGMVLKIPSPTAPSTTMETSAGAPPGPPAEVTNGKYIKVVLHEQRVYVYENGQMIHTMLGSSGLPGTPTVQGDFKIYVKYTAQLMVGTDYYLPGVPWVMYFYQGYSFHGTYWHHNFGHPMSHGCVNLPTDEALWLYNWAEIGTPVHVQW
jgi:LysM repeat protein